MDILPHNLRFAVRSLVRTPGFTAAAVLALALGIGATSAIFSVVHAVLLRSLGWDDESRVAEVTTVESPPPSLPGGGMRLTNSIERPSQSGQW